MNFDSLTPLAAALGALIKPLMDKLCSASWWEKRYDAKFKKGWSAVLTRLLHCKQPPDDRPRQ